MLLRWAWCGRAGIARRLRIVLETEPLTLPAQLCFATRARQFDIRPPVSPPECQFSLTQGLVKRVLRPRTLVKPGSPPFSIPTDRYCGSHLQPAKGKGLRPLTPSKAEPLKSLLLRNRRPQLGPGAAPPYQTTRGTRNGSIACTHGVRNRSIDRLSCIAVAASPSTCVASTDRA